MAGFRKTAQNLLSLTAIQGANAVLPLIIYPVSLGRMGAHSYGLIVQAEALSLFLLSVVLFSFEVTGVAAVVGLDPKRDNGAISEIFSTIIALRLMLFAVGAPVMLIAAYLVNPELLLPACAWCLVPLSFAVSPNWLFQGLEANVELAISNVISRGSAVVLILTLVRGPDDYLLVPLIIGSCYLGGAICSLLIGTRVHHLKAMRVDLRRMLTMLSGGRHVFLGNLSTTLYRDTNTLLLGVLGASSGAIAAYSMAEKLAKALQAVIRPLNQHYFPKAILLAKGRDASKQTTLLGMMRLAAVQQALLAGFIVLGGVAYLVFGGEVSRISRIPELDHVVILFFVMSIATLFGVGNFMLGTAGLNALGETRYVLTALVVTGIVSLAIGSALIYGWADVGAAISFVLGEALLFAILVRGYLRPTTSGALADGAKVQVDE